MSTKTASEIVIYEGDNARVEVRLDRESVWLTQEQVGLLFGRERSVITKHIRNVFAEGELERAAVCANFAHTAADGKTYQVDHYNLDVIISVGYRVKSIQGTRFRQWATRVLREHLTQGFSLDRERFEKNATELEAALQLVRKAAAGEALTADQGRGLVDVIARYTHTFLWLQRYDEGLLTAPTGSPGGVLPTLEEAHAAIARLKADLMARGEASDLFGRDRGDAQRTGRNRYRPRAPQAGAAGRCVYRSLAARRLLRRTGGDGAQHGSRDAPQRRALPLHEVGGYGAAGGARASAGYRHHAYT